MLLLHLTQNLVTGLPLLSVAQSFFAHHLDATNPAPTDAFGKLNSFATAVQNGLQGLGLSIFVIGVIIAGMMRMMSFGSDRRVAVSNMALTAAVVGLIIMLMASAIYNLLYNNFH